jgi:hypothetical protein
MANSLMWSIGSYCLPEEGLRKPTAEVSKSAQRCSVICHQKETARFTRRTARQVRCLCSLWQHLCRATRTAWVRCYATFCNTAGFFLTSSRNYFFSSFPSVSFSPSYHRSLYLLMFSFLAKRTWRLPRTREFAASYHDLCLPFTTLSFEGPG